MLWMLVLWVPVVFALGGGDPPPLEPDSAFDGTWELVSEHYDGKVPRPSPGLPGEPPRPPRSVRVTAKDGTWNVVLDKSRGYGFATWDLDRTARSPWPEVMRTQTWTALGSTTSTMRGIYRLDGDTLTFSFCKRGEPLPTGFEPIPGRLVEVYHRVQS